MTNRRYQQTRQITFIGIIVNIFLALIKTFFGLLGHSQALLADGFHSIADLATDGLVIVAAKLGSAKPDETHPYGHQRIETVMTVLLAVLLLVVAAGIVWEGAETLFHRDYVAPADYLVWIALISTLLNEWLFRITQKVGRKIHSSLLIANAWHHRSDAFSSLVVVFGLISVLLGFRYGDAIAAIIVGLLILYIAFKMILKSMQELIDAGIDPTQLECFKAKVIETEGVLALHAFRSRLSGGAIYLDLHVEVSPDISVSEGHYITLKVDQALRSLDLPIQDVMIHIDIEADDRDEMVCQLPTRSRIESEISALFADIDKKIIHKINLHYQKSTLDIEIILHAEKITPAIKMQLIEARNRYLLQSECVKTMRFYFCDQDF